MEMNGGINPGAEFIANLHIFGRIPTPHAFILYVSIEAFGKGLVCTGITDEERVVLNGLTKERWEVLNQCVRETTAPQKGQGERSGFGEGAMVEGTGTMVPAGL